jgi:hypothetical protein
MESCNDLLRQDSIQEPIAMSDAVNLYAPPKAQVEDVVPDMGEADAIRREHIKTEASIRSVGILYYLGGFILCVAAIGFLGGTSHVTFARNPGLPPGVVGVMYLVFGVFSLFLAWGIRRLRPWARVAGIVFTSIGLLGFPVGTLINAYILYLFLCKQGKRIFASDYPEIIAATPGVKYKTSIVVWIVLALLLLAIVGIAVATLTHR